MLWAVVMAGGQGTRFWPESRAHQPKQFLQIFGPKTLLEQTLERLPKSIDRARVLVVTQGNKAAWVARLLKIPAAQVVGEPVGRNTAPCAILAAALAVHKDPEAVLAILPSDHRIENPKAYRAALLAGARTAWEKKMPVTFGMKPHMPHTGYGYLELGDKMTGAGDVIYRLERFHEKPDLEKAKFFLKTKRFLWNSGIFVWRADGLLEAAKAIMPEAHELALQIAGKNFAVQMKKLYHRMPNISIDYGLMEKLNGKILTLPADFGWNDMGDWKTLAKFWPHDKNGNAVIGDVLTIDSSGNIVRAGKRLAVLLGVRDCLIVDTEDALLICPKGQTESIRKVVAQLKEKKRTRYL